jgi:retron-type reverse transcriptase
MALLRYTLVLAFSVGIFNKKTVRPRSHGTWLSHLVNSLVSNLARDAAQLWKCPKSYPDYI